jgi:hypothetical protein
VKNSIPPGNAWSEEPAIGSQAELFFPDASLPGHLAEVDLMVKDSKRFADNGGWRYAVFAYDAASDTFKPGTLVSKPPQGNDAKCGFACHTIVRTKDYICAP